MQRVGQHLREQGTCQSLSHVLPCSNTEMQQGQCPWLSVSYEGKLSDVRPSVWKYHPDNSAIKIPDRLSQMIARKMTL
ncbi:hypothetical protein J6590_030300 [Homalodisca vitripennis]|nr:hypothetical protein J6590_096349 [Homalodisca vitripennis]KAG8292841.1 hypothetical protein J6590_030300 [Homalodisca vitripennis]